MEHAVERLMAYLDIEQVKLIREWSSGEYKKLSDCPSYETVKAYCDAINILNKHWMRDYEPISPRSLVQERRREL
ncbi:hypothetical protein NXH76_17285 [Blautia schinkii]|nr:hypothetical protein [Blautia schinkii]